ncbi:MAG: type II secretion system protein [Dehalococcoidales bacterium]|nr:type II secretion system protein [Dehalococcoidales bacterium]
MRKGSCFRHLIGQIELKPFSLIKDNRGFSTIEIMISIVLLGILTIAFLPSLMLAFNTSAKIGINQGSKNLAEIIMQGVMQLPFDIDASASSSDYKDDLLTLIPAEYSTKGYTADIQVYYPRNPDNNLQRIRVIITNNSGVSSVTVDNGGSGYTSAPDVILTGGGGTGAEAVAIISGGEVVEIDITNGGTGYTSAPDVSFSGGGGAGAAANAKVLPARILDGYKLNQ